MPYAHNDDLPVSLRRALPSHAQDIFRSAFNAAWRSYGRAQPSRREEIAHRVAWSAVKRRYQKFRGKWRAIDFSKFDRRQSPARNRQEE